MAKVTFRRLTNELQTLEGGGGGGGLTTYNHTQGTPSTTWVIPHNLGRKPTIELRDSTDKVLEGEVVHDITLTFSTVTLTIALAGSARCV
jgi:hypothetical protein